MTRTEILELAIENDEKYAEMLFEDALTEFATEIVNLVLAQVESGIPAENVQARNFVKQFRIEEEESV